MFSDNKKGGNPLPLLGLLLYIIGYVGVFFGHLIKSAVSRQREFLADASAVQFTRLPDGIAGALKKIGGLVHGSKLTTARAEEASHMFFGNGLRRLFLQLLATHPPLEERIRRIDPQFDGRFPQVVPVHFTTDDLVDPQTMLAQRRGRGERPRGRGCRRKAFAQNPATAVAQVGEPRMEHVEYATAVVGALPIEVAAAVRDPLGAVATVYALLLDQDEGNVRRMQLEYLAAQADPRATAETRRIAPYVTSLRPEARLPLVALALPALEGLSERRRGAFGDDVVTLIKADKKVSLFEYAVHRLILKRLVERLTPRRPRPAVPPSQDRLAPAVSGLLSTLAHWGTTDQNDASRAFAAAVRNLPSGVRIELLPRTKCGLPALDAALDQLAFAPPAVKKSLLEACAASIGYDGKATVEEAELLRVISDALDCPMPPLVNVQATT